MGGREPGGRQAGQSGPEGEGFGREDAMVQPVWLLFAVRCLLCWGGVCVCVGGHGGGSGRGRDGGESERGHGSEGREAKATPRPSLALSKAPSTNEPANERTNHGLPPPALSPLGPPRP
jgi:hypothetical protein